MLANNHATTRAHREAIVTYSRDDLEPGRLGDTFRAGAKAVVLEDDYRVREIWGRILGSPDWAIDACCGPMFSWESNLLTLARNHETGNLSSGDMLRFVSQGIAHIARKVLLWPDPDGRMKAVPDSFYIGSDKVALPDDLLRTTWDLMADIVHSAFPRNYALPPYCVSIEILQYPKSLSDLDQIFNLLKDSGGAWTRLGYKLDAHRIIASGIFDKKVIRELFALALLIPRINPILIRMNNFLKKPNEQDIPADTRIIGEPHIDGEKIITALAGDRDTIRTEIYKENHWLELGMTPHALAIFPSNQMDKQLGILPTKHRVLLQTHTNSPNTSRPNITLALTAKPRS